MLTKKNITRRRMLKVAMAGASGIMAGTKLQGAEQDTVPADPKIQGPFLILLLILTLMKVMGILS